MGLISLVLMFLVILNVSFNLYQNDKTAKRYNEESEYIYSDSGNVFDEQYSTNYKARMYVSKEDKDWLISDYEDGVSVKKLCCFVRYCLSYFFHKRRVILIQYQSYSSCSPSMGVI